MNLKELVSARHLSEEQRGAARELEGRGYSSFTDIVKAIGEPALAILSASVSEPLAGLAGLAVGAFGDVNRAANVIQLVQDKLTYTPRTEAGRAGMQTLSTFMQPVGEAVGETEDYLGGAAMSATGSPFLAAAAATLPAALMELNPLGKINRQAGKLDIFAGKKANNADLRKMEAAQELANRGMDRDKIWKETGWFKDVDDHWKFELDDSRSTIQGRDFNKEIMDAVELGGEEGRKNRMAAVADMKDYTPPHEQSTILAGVLDHEELFDNYPDAKSILYDRDPSIELGGASYTPTENAIRMSEMNKGAIRSPLLHETQHAIQEVEGFSKGGMPASFERGLVQSVTHESTRLQAEVDGILGSEAFRADKAALRADGVPRHEQTQILYEKYGINEKVDKIYEAEGKIKDLTSYDKYQRLAGEAEARNVETRKNMTPDQRAAKPPWQTLDVPENELIIHRNK